MNTVKINGSVFIGLELGGVGTDPTAVEVSDLLERAAAFVAAGLEEAKNSLL